MRSPTNWFLVLACVSIAAPYVLGVRPKSAKEWRYIVLTVAFLAWILLFMVSVRSR